LRYFRSSNPNLTDSCSVIYGYCDEAPHTECGGVPQCFDNVSPSVVVNSNDVLECFDSCECCQGLCPTPSPTPTINPTSTPTPTTTPSLTPTLTSTPTLTPTSTSTSTPTPTTSPTVTGTLTPTPTQTRLADCYQKIYFDVTLTETFFSYTDCCSGEVNILSVEAGVDSWGAPEGCIEYGSVTVISGEFNNLYYNSPCACPTPTPTLTASNTPTPTTTNTPTLTASNTPTPTTTSTPTNSPTTTNSPTPTLTQTPTASVTQTPTPTQTEPTVTQSVTPSQTPTQSFVFYPYSVTSGQTFVSIDCNPVVLTQTLYAAESSWYTITKFYSDSNLTTPYNGNDLYYTNNTLGSSDWYRIATNGSITDSYGC
jgi:hypothetical protein